MKVDTIAEPLTLSVDVPRALGDADRHRDDLEAIAALALALLATGARRAELLRRLRGYEPREMGYEVTP